MLQRLAQRRKGSICLSAAIHLTGTQSSRFSCTTNDLSGSRWDPSAVTTQLCSMHAVKIKCNTQGLWCKCATCHYCVWATHQSLPAPGGLPTRQTVPAFTEGGPGSRLHL